MIQFSCHCGHRFSVADDQAGGTIQCPDCRKLNDIPLLSDLPNIDADGIYKLDAPPRLKDDPKRVAELTRVFTRDHYDADGQPIDLREAAGWRQPAGQVPLVPLESEKPIAPKYDPVTGELVRELVVKPDTAPAPDTLPVAKLAPVQPRRVVDGMDVPHPLEAFAIPLLLFRPVNLIVMSFILLAHFVGQLMSFAIAALYLILVPFWVIWHGLIIAHFGNVIDEAGPVSRSELPTPLRSLSWDDDTFGPFCRVMGAFLVSYGPAAVMLLYLKNVPDPVALAISGGLALAGTLFFPAALITTITSGSVVNLRPDRIIGVAIACGMEYLVVVTCWVIGGALWLSGTIAINWIAWASFDHQAPRVPQGLTAAVAYGILAVGIYLMHFFCWHLGTLYRRNHERFPWAYQRHIHKNRPPQSGFPVAKREQ